MQEHFHTHKNRWLIIGAVVVIAIIVLLVIKNSPKNMDGGLSAKEQQAILDALAQSEQQSAPLTAEQHAEIVASLESSNSKPNELSEEEQQAILDALKE